MRMFSNEAIQRQGPKILQNEVSPIILYMSIVIKNLYAMSGFYTI